MSTSSAVHPIMIVSALLIVAATTCDSSVATIGPSGIVRARALGQAIVTFTATQPPDAPQAASVTILVQ